MLLSIVISSSHRWYDPSHVLSLYNDIAESDFESIDPVKFFVSILAYGNFIPLFLQSVLVIISVFTKINMMCVYLPKFCANSSFHVRLLI